MDKKELVFESQIINITKDTKLNQIIEIKESKDVEQEIIVDENVKCRIIIWIKQECEEKVVKIINNIKIKGNKSSKIELIKIQMLNDNAIYEEKIESFMEESSSIQYYDIIIGAKNTISRYYTNLIGNNAKGYFDSIYLCDKERELELDYKINLFGKDTIGHMNTKGALLDKAKKKYFGSIDFKEGSKGADGLENEKTILLSDKVRNYSVPILLCHEEDVSGVHAASAGKIEENMLFYIMSRGFSEIEAKKLAVKANFASVLDKIENIDVLEKINKEINKRLDDKKE